MWRTESSIFGIIFYLLRRITSYLLIDLPHVQALCSGVEFSQRTLVRSVFTVEVILLGSDETLSTAAGVC